MRRCWPRTPADFRSMRVGSRFFCEQPRSTCFFQACLFSFRSRLLQLSSTDGVRVSIRSDVCVCQVCVGALHTALHTELFLLPVRCYPLLLRNAATHWNINSNPAIQSRSLCCYNIFLLSLLSDIIFTEVFLPRQSYWSLSCDHGLHCTLAMS